jgi:acyl-[acyl-carrier-protein]-phospholipid O-acyltransferase/long-chain-fatty-acid--[acyl-carrier-protein] ligase
MSAPQWGLLARRRFLPLFATQFFGAFNDNLYRSAMLFLVTFTLYRGEADRAAMVAVLSGGVFILPYFLFSSVAGQLADRVDKARVARFVKVAEIAILAAGALALDTGSLPLMMTVLFAMGVHSTIFGPIKYSMLPQHLAETELMGGTGLVEAGTFLAILMGQLAGGLLPTATATALMLGVAGLGLAASLFIPPAPPEGERPAIEPNLIRSTARIVGHARRNHSLYLAILGISWFFALGAVLTQQFAPLVGRLNGTPAVGALFLGLFSVGVAIGSLMVGRLLGGVISARYVPAAALVLALGVIDLGFTIQHLVPAPAAVGVRGFLDRPGSWHLVADLIAIAVAGGVFVVPLYALLQTLGDAASRSRDVAANNIVNAAGMVLVSLLVALLMWAGAGSLLLYVALGVLGLVAALVMCGLLPRRALLRGA